MAEPPKNRLQSRRGFTLVELLVAIFVLGVLLAALGGLTSGLLGFTRQTSSLNQKLTDLNDALGYMALTVRSAAAVVDGVVEIVPPDGGPPPLFESFDCAPDTPDNECLSVLVPVVDRDNGNVIGYRLHSYRWVTVADWGGYPGTAPDPDALVLLEYVSIDLCDSPCVDPPTITPPVKASQAPALVIADLSRVGLGGDGPFSVDGNLVTIELRTEGTGRDAGQFVPRDSPSRMAVFPRP